MKIIWIVLQPQHNNQLLINFQLASILKWIDFYASDSIGRVLLNGRLH